MNFLPYHEIMGRGKKEVALAQPKKETAAPAKEENCAFIL